MDRVDRKQLARKAAVLGAAAALVAVAAALSSPPVRASSPPAPGEAPAASASASAPAGPASAGSASAGAALPTLRSADIPAEASPEPNNAEWKDGKAVRPHRGALDRCKLTLIREWLRVTCKDWVGATLAAGDPEGVKMWMTGARFNEKNPQAVTVILPLRRGRSQVFTFLNLWSGYEAASLGEGGAMSVLWRDGQEDPVIVLGLFPED